MDYDQEEVLARLIGFGLGASVAFATANLLMSSADSWSTSSLTAARQNHQTGILELATCARCVEQLLAGRPSKKAANSPPTAGAFSAGAQAATALAGAPVVM